MFSSKQLSDEQIETIKAWAAEGANLSDIQLKLKEDMEKTVTFMDTRFLILDLGITLVEEKEEEPEPVAEDPIPTGSVTLTKDTIAVPGMMVSGSITFSDGEKGIWGVDPSGRPSLDPDTPGYKPSEEDILEIQVKLRELLDQAGA